MKNANQKKMYAHKIGTFGFTDEQDAEMLMSGKRKRKRARIYRGADGAAPISPESQVLITLKGKGKSASEIVTGFRLPEDIKTLPVPVTILFSPDFTPAFRKREGYRYDGKADFSIREAPIVAVDKVDDKLYLVTEDGFGLLFDKDIREKMVYQTASDAGQISQDDAGAGDSGAGSGGGAGGSGGGWGGYDPFYPPPFYPPIIITTPNVHGRPIARPTHTTFGHANLPALNGGSGGGLVNTLGSLPGHIGGGSRPLPPRPTTNTFGHANLPALGGGNRPLGRPIGGGSIPRPVGRRFDGTLEDDSVLVDKNASGITGEHRDDDFLYLGGRMKAAKALGLKGAAARKFARKLKKEGWKKGEEIPVEALKSAPATPTISKKLETIAKKTKEEALEAYKQTAQAAKAEAEVIASQINSAADEVAGLSTPIKAGLAIGIPLILFGGFLLVKKFMKPKSA